MRLVDQLRSAPFLIAAGYALLFSVSVTVVLGFVYWAVDREITGQVRRAVALDVLPLEEAYRHGGTARLIQAMGERVRAAPEGQAFYLLTTWLGHPLAGNIRPVPSFDGWREFNLIQSRSSETADPSPKRVPVIAFGTPLGRTFLMVGRDALDVHQTRALVLDAFGLSVGVTLLLALVGGFAMSRGTLRRIERITRTTREIVAGDLNSRVPIGTVRDDLDRLGININTMLDRIHELMESLRQVSTDIAHDLRTPLGRLRQRLEEAQRQRLDPEQLDAVLAAAVAETDAILETFGALLRIAQIEAGGQRAQFQPVELSAVATTILEAYQSVAEDQDQRLEGVIAEGVMVIGDRNLLTVLLANLVENALRHCPAATLITLTLRRSGDAHGDAGTGRAGRDGRAGSDEECGVELVVADTGPGIPAAQRVRVLQRFYRLEASRTTSGNGLGLALVKAVVELHGATLHLEDNRPGLKVRVSFPYLARGV